MECPRHLHRSQGPLPHGKQHRRGVRTLIPQPLKDLYYAALRPLSAVLRPIYAWHWRTFRAHLRRAHVGCGANYLEGFVNIDGNPARRVDYLLDARSGLPFPDGSLELIYSCHMLEHVHVWEAAAILRECRRALAVGGRMRLTLPDLHHALAILDGESESTFPRRFESRDGMAANFLFCDGQHKYAYGLASLAEMARAAGFSRIEPAQVNRDEVLGALDEPAGSFAANLYP